MKKSFILGLFVAASLVACKEQKAEETPVTEPTTVETPTAVDSSATPAAPADSTAAPAAH
jgi:hypothetical protein